VAARLARRHLERDLPEASEIAFALRAAGAPYVWPRVWALRGAGAGSEAVLRADAWIRSLSFEGDARCALQGARNDAGNEAWVALAVDVLADLRALPTSATVGSAIDFEAQLLFDTPHAELLLLGPRGLPRHLSLARESRTLRSTFRTEHAGVWLVQLMADAAGGPRPVAEALVFAGTEPDPAFASRIAPGEDVPLGDDPAAALFAMANQARSSEGTPTLRRHATLDSVALSHARAMQQAARLAHDVGSGTPDRRVEDAGLRPRSVGENVAHAMDARSAHRVLWSSPSHRQNLLTRRFDHLGVGLASDPDGTLWVAEVFAELDALGLAP
jgi:uncharacterized protein YkwD